jgi:hypothetical protein
VADGLDRGNHVAPEIQLGECNQRVQPLNAGYVISSQVEYAELCQSDQTFDPADTVGMKIENVKVMKVFEAFKLINMLRKNISTFAQEMKAKHLAYFVLAEHEHTQLGYSMQTGHCLDGVVVQIEKNQVREIPDISNGLNIIVLIIEQPETLFAFEHRACGQLAIVNTQTLWICALVLTASDIKRLEEHNVNDGERNEPMTREQPWLRQAFDQVETVLSTCIWRNGNRHRIF